MKKITVHFTVNHEPVTVEVEPNHRLLDVLRNNLGLCTKKKKPRLLKRWHKMLRVPDWCISDIREEKVETIKKQMKEGTYRVSTEDVAEKILSSMTGSIF